MHDIIAIKTQSISVVIKHVPNCPIVYTQDETKRGRYDENFYAHAYGEFLRDPDLDPRKLNIFPMVKSVFMGMKAT